MSSKHTDLENIENNIATPENGTKSIYGENPSALLNLESTDISFNTGEWEKLINYDSIY